MKLQLESITPNESSSFSLMVNPRLHNFFFWHSHLEYELVYIEATSGTRHVGEHIARYEGNDLVLIGSHIPHLNFDYGIKTNYEKIVVHIQQDYLGSAFACAPELQAIKTLFERSKFGIGFGSETKQKVGQRLKNLPYLPYFEQFIEMLSLFELLAHAPDQTLLHEQPVENRYNAKEQERLKRLYRFIDENYQRKIEIEEVATLSNLSKAAFCRYFKKMTLLTFTEFLNHYRVTQAQKLLLLDKNITETCFECGFESLSYFNRTFKKIAKENPLAFKKRYISQQ